MRKKMIGILVVTLLIATAIPAMGIAEINENKNNNQNEIQKIFFYDIQVDDENNIIPLSLNQLDQSQTQANNNLLIDSYGCAQSFKPSLSTLTKFSIYLSSTFDINGHWSFGTYHVSIRKGSLTSSDILYGTVQSSDLPIGTSFWLNFHTSSPVPVTPGDTYYIVIFGTNPTIWAAAELYWWYGSWTSYANGEAYYKDGLAWWLLFMGSADFCFKTYGTSIPDDPPIVVINSPPDGHTTSIPTITVTGYAKDDIGVTTFGTLHEWGVSNQNIVSSTLPQPYQTYNPFSEGFILELGWNRITIFVTDTSGQPAEDQIEVYYVINLAPLKPSDPSGPSKGKSGKSYIYSTSTTDPEGDQLFYQWDWGHEKGTWDGPYNSGDTVFASHIFPSDGSYSIKVKAKDSSGEESPWSDPVSITMPKNKPYINRPILNFLEQHSNLFPILRQLLLKI